MQKSTSLLFLMLVAQCTSVHAVRRKPLEKRLDALRSDRNTALLLATGSILLINVVGSLRGDNNQEDIHKTLWLSLGTASILALVAAERQYSIWDLRRLHASKK